MTTQQIPNTQCNASTHLIAASKAFACNNIFEQIPSTQTLYTPSPTEYAELYRKIFGSSPLDSYKSTSEQSDSNNPDTEQTFLNLYDEKLLRELSDRASIGREERRFYSSLQSLSPLRALIEPNPAIFDHIEELFALYPNATELLKYVYDFLRLRKLSQQRRAIYFNPICIAGPAGIGKTAVIKAISKALRVDYAFYDFSSASSSWGLSGQDSGWNGSHIGLVAKTLFFGGCGNPILQIDEVDKGPINANIDPYLALYTLLERPQMLRFIDAFAQNLPINAEFVMFMATANDIGKIPGPIRTRFRIIHIEPPSIDQMRSISLNMYKNLLHQESVEAAFASTLSEEVVNHLSTKTPREAGLMLDRGLASAASRPPPENERYKISLDDLFDTHSPDFEAKNKMGFIW